MKTYNNLFEDYISDDNILSAIISAKRGKKSKRTKQRLNNILLKKDKWIPKLRNIAINFYNKPHSPKEIYDGISKKKRTIIVPSPIELIIQHMQINILQPIFMKGMYAHTYASIPNRGAHLGKKHLEKWIKQDKKQTKYCLKLDIHHFFESISKTLLKEKLASKIKDDKFLNALYTVIDANEKGLPLGYYTSQWYANYYLQEFDNFIKQQLKVKYYIRYMDDMVILSGNKRKLHKIFYAISNYLSTLSLQIKSNYRIFPITDTIPIDFMGFKFYNNRTTLRKSILLKATRKANRISKKSSITAYDAKQFIAYLGNLNITDTTLYSNTFIFSKVNSKQLRNIISIHDRKEHYVVYN